jgi:hypothetical protein
MHNPAGFVLLTDEKYIQYFLDTFKTDEDITYKKLNEYFGHKIEMENKKIKKVYPPIFFTTDEFMLPKGTLENVFKTIQTSIGFYIFNLFCLNPIFKDRLEYYNPEDGLTPDNVEALVQKIVDMMIENKVSGEEFAEFQTRFNWLMYKGTLWTPGQSFEFAKVNPDVAKNKPILLKKWKEAVAEGADPVSSYVIMVEKPLLEIAKKSLKNNQAWPIYSRGGKPKFGNMYKNCTVSMGPVYDPITGGYKIADSSFMEGIDNNMVPTFANIQIDAAYNRAVATQDGGAKTKQIFAAFQSVKLNPEKGHDCGSKRYIEKLITGKNLSKNYLRYILDEKTGKLVRLTKDNISQYEGKVVKMRTPLFCQDPDYCNICAGDYFYELGLENIGNASTRLSSTLMNKALKAMHDVSVDADKMDPMKYMEVEK